MASRIEKIGVWSQAGRVARLDFGGFWWAAVPKENWPDVDAIREQIAKRWHDEVGDCRQEWVFIGIGIDEIELYDSLQRCLISDTEMNAGPETWAFLPDPSPAWNVSIERLIGG